MFTLIIEYLLQSLVYRFFKNNLSLFGHMPQHVRGPWFVIGHVKIIDVTALDK